MKNSTLQILIKKSTGLLCLVLLLLSANSNSVLLIDYQIRKAAYEKACENQAAPELKCHGKCQLTKNMTQSLQQESSNQPFVGSEANSKVHPKSPAISSLKIEIAKLLSISYLSQLKAIKYSFYNQLTPFQEPIEIITPPPRFS